MKNNRRIALSGIMAALAVVIMYFAAVTELLSLSGVIFAAFAIVFIYIEYGTGTALTVYAAVSVISLLILPDKFSALLYAAYAGYYPVLKAKLEEFSPRISWILKLVSFNIVLAATILLSRYITAMGTETPVIEAVVFVLGNVVFILADILATRLIVIYLVKIRPQLQRRGLL